MKTCCVIVGVLTAAAAALGQSRMGPQSVREIYGANPTTTAPAAPKPPAAPAAEAAAPAPATLAPAAGPSIVPLPAPAPVAMPGTIEGVDNTRKLAIGDQFRYQVIEDRDPDAPPAIVVDGQGNANIPLLGPRPVAGKTLQEVARAVKQELDEKYYFNATVVAAFNIAARGRNQYYLIGVPITNQGLKELPADQVLKVSRAIHAAGVNLSIADVAHVTLVRPDPATPGKENITTMDLSPYFSSGTSAPGDVTVEPGDSIFVPLKGEAKGTITVVGRVNRQGRQLLPANGKLTVTQAIFDAGGLDQWGHPEVTVIRLDPVKGKIKLAVDTEAVLFRGEADKDLVLQDGDIIVAGQKWISF